VYSKFEKYDKNLTNVRWAHYSHSANHLHHLHLHLRHLAIASRESLTESGLNGLWRICLKRLRKEMKTHKIVFWSFLTVFQHCFDLQCKMESYLCIRNSVSLCVSITRARVCARARACACARCMANVCILVSRKANWIDYCNNKTTMLQCRNEFFPN